MANCLACKVQGVRKKATKGKYCTHHYEESKALKRRTILPLKDYWYSLMGRCYKEHWVLYKTYGAKGYTVCEEWHDRDTFISWALKQGYKKGRILKVEGLVYSPDTCKFESK